MAVLDVRYRLDTAFRRGFPWGYCHGVIVVELALALA